MSPSIGATAEIRRYEYRHYPPFAWHIGRAASACHDVLAIYIISLARV
jgi:hypothetical protein